MGKIKDDKILILQYLYDFGCKAENKAVPIRIIHPALKISGERFNDALDLLLSENPILVIQSHNCLYITKRGLQWYEEWYENNNSETSINKIAMQSTNNLNPTVFISYSWDNDSKIWVKHLASELRKNGIDAKLDQWEIVPGDQMPNFMEKSVRENDYVLIICSPEYKIKSDGRKGGVGYEGDIMTAEVLQKANNRKFIPILQSGDKNISMPSWLMGKFFIDLSSDLHFINNFEDLLTTILQEREVAPPIGNIRNKPSITSPTSDNNKPNESENVIRIKGIVVDEISQPKNDGTAGSALYKIPFELNNFPNYEWIQLFIQSFNRPAIFTSMHRPGIASVYGNKILLDGTTIEEVEQYHKRTLKIAVEAANKIYGEHQALIRQKDVEDRKRNELHKKNIDDISQRISFDD